MSRILLPFLLVFLFIAESNFVALMPEEIFGGNYILIPHFLIVAILFLTVYGPKKYWLLYAFIFGLLFDIVYTEIIGIYLFLFPVIAYLMTKLMKVLQTNILIVSLASLIFVTLLELASYEINFLIHITDMDISSYLSNRLVPTLILNLIFIIIAAYPFKKYFRKIVESLDV